MNKVIICAKEYPSRVTMGAMIDFKHETGKELTRIRNETGKEEKPPGVVREPTGWQWFQIWTGRIAVICLILIVIKRRFYKTKK